MDRFVAAQLVTRKASSLYDRETLAEAAHRKKCAKHKGRNHWRNWERRLMLKEKREAQAKITERKLSAYFDYRKQVRKYWQGSRPDMPKKPA